MSDKTRPLTGPSAVDGFLDSAKPFTFRYKNPADGLSTDPSKNVRPFAGVMAQNLEKDPIGAQTVTRTPHGLQLEIKPLVSALTAAAGRMHGRLDKLEGAHMGLMGAVRHHAAKIDEQAQMIDHLHKLLGAGSRKQ